jgi:predicted DNA-binding transcriptional regulator AlpA
MKLIEGWLMYSKIQELKELNLNVSQIARHVGISRNTVYKFINMTSTEFNQAKHYSGNNQLIKKQGLFLATTLSSSC